MNTEIQVAEILKKKNYSNTNYTNINSRNTEIPIIEIKKCKLNNYQLYTNCRITETHVNKVLPIFQKSPIFKWSPIIIFLKLNNG